MKVIYIPICFYYFSSLKHKFIDYLILFTFQYVSIISPAFASVFVPSDVFTFQYVSIISITDYFQDTAGCYIYIPICFYYFGCKRAGILTTTTFTFQYVSIISSEHGILTTVWDDLHSNMFLLFPQGDEGFACEPRFTFQYVSIISKNPHSTADKEKVFTFQYVSIISFLMMWKI